MFIKNKRQDVTENSTLMFDGFNVQSYPPRCLLVGLAEL